MTAYAGEDRMTSAIRALPASRNRNLAGTILTVLGALFLTGYLGGAIATHVRVGNPLLSHSLFPIYVALLVWGGLYLREPRLRELLPLRR